VRALDTSTLLDAWDCGHSLSADAWALWLLRAAGAGGAEPAGALLQWPVGRRDRALLRLRSLTFGTRVMGLVECPCCGSAAEFDVAADALFVSGPAGDDPAPVRLDIDGLSVTCRPVTAGDLLAINGCGDLDSATTCLVERCVRAERQDGTCVAVRDLPEAALDEVTAQLEQVDPQADVRLALQCPACGHAWQVMFDIVTFFWRELGAWGARQLRDVHELASAYGWSEAQILSLSPARRRRYLGMLTS
jgi:hypothetical protein